MTTGTLHMPRLGETMEEGKLVSWLVRPGETFKRGDPILEVETDKTVVEYPALGDGALAETLVELGEMVSVGTPIAMIELGDSPDWTAVEAIEDDSEVALATAGDGRVTVDLPMPRLGETMEEGKLVAWLVEPGQDFKRGDALVEVETDKTVAEFPALADGTLVNTLVELGTTLAVGTPIARLQVAAVDRAAFADEHETAADAAPANADAAPRAEAVGYAAPHPAVPGGPLRATPLARRTARRLGVDLASVQGTGRRGRIEARDVEAAVQGVGEAPAIAHGLAYLETGPANGVPVALLHGFAADHTAWAALQSQLSRAGRRVLSADLPGHGASRVEAGALSDLAPPVAALLTDRFGGRPLHLIAHSMGAIAALALADEIPLASLTLIAPAGLGPARDPDFIDGLARAATVEEVAPRLDRMTEGPTGLSHAALVAVAADLARRRLTALATDLNLTPAMIDSTRERLARLAESLPVRLILGHRDRITGWQDALAVSPLIGVHHMPAVGHMPQWEALPQVAAIISEVTEDR